MLRYSTDSPEMPAPRLIARSMLSLGTDVFLAFCTASYRVGFPARSAPPILAATSMFLMSLANDFARRASMTAFLCFVVAHLECPLTVPLSMKSAGKSSGAISREPWQPHARPTRLERRKRAHDLRVTRPPCGHDAWRDPGELPRPGAVECTQGEQLLAVLELQQRPRLGRTPCETDARPQPS